jgi:hypothetical protein
MELTQIPVEKFTTEAALDTEFYLLPGGQVLVLTPGAEPVAFHSVKAEAGGMGRPAGGAPGRPAGRPGYAVAWCVMTQGAPWLRDSSPSAWRATSTRCACPRLRP